MWGNSIWSAGWTLPCSDYIYQITTCMQTMAGASCITSRDEESLYRPKPRNGRLLVCKLLVGDGLAYHVRLDCCRQHKLPFSSWIVSFILGMRDTSRWSMTRSLSATISTVRTRGWLSKLRVLPACILAMQPPRILNSHEVSLVTSHEDLPSCFRNESGSNRNYHGQGTVSQSIAITMIVDSMIQSRCISMTFRNLRMQVTMHSEEVLWWSFDHLDSGTDSS